MATGKGPGSADLILYRRLAEDPEKHHIFQALRIIEAQHPDRPRLGESRRLRQDAVRLGQDPELAFPPNTISAFTPAQGDKPARLTNRFFGLFGPHGPLPLHITEYVRDRLRNHRDSTFVGFANMVTHRMMSLFYRAWSSAEPAPSFDRQDDPVAERVAALAGYRGEHLKNRDAMPDMARLSFAALLGQGPKNADGLISIVSSFFNVEAHIQQFVGTWLQLEPDDRWRLGHTAVLGQSTSIGEKVWSRASKFRLRIGPLTLKDYERLLPGNRSQEQLQSIVRSYAGDTLEWDVNLVLAGPEVPRSSLGGNTRLGHISWIGTRRDADDVRPDADDLFLYPRI